MDTPKELDLSQLEGHTPGPWESHCDLDVTGYPVFYLHGFAGEQKRDAATLVTNARLIAAAPQLLEEVKRLRERVRLLTENPTTTSGL